MTAGRLWAASVASLVLAILAVYALSSLVAFFVIVAVTLWLAGVVGGAAAVGAWADEHHRADEAERRAKAEKRRADDLTDELVSAVAAAESLALELSHADATIRNLAAQVVAQAETYVGDKGTRLQLVTPEWPKIARVLDIEAGEQG